MQSMRAVWLMPVTYFAGIHGFGYFVPYLIFVGAVAGIVGLLRKRAAKPVPIPIRNTPRELELEPASA